MPGIFQFKRRVWRVFNNKPFPNFVPALPFFPKIWRCETNVSYQATCFLGSKEKVFLQSKVLLELGLMDAFEASKGSQVWLMSELCKVPKEPNKLVSITPNQLVKFPVNQLCAGKRQNTVCAVDSDVSVYIYIIWYIHANFLQWR